MAITQRDAFFQRLYDQGVHDFNFYFVASDQGAPTLDQYRVNLGQRFIDAGISEQNAILLASGLAFDGRNVYVHAIANFITLRCLEQIRIELSVMNIPVKVVGVGAGYSYDDSGPTHHSTEDLAMLRALPNMNIYNVTDSEMAIGIADLTYKMNSPTYIRLDRKAGEIFYKRDEDFKKGWAEVREGRDVILVGTGNMTEMAIKLREKLKASGLSAKVVDVYKLPIEDSLKEIFSDDSKVFTLEEHYLPGGFGSAILEKLSDWGVRCFTKRLGVEHEEKFCYVYGGRENLQKEQKIDLDFLHKMILDNMKKFV